jgi:hypothetical protein
MITFAEWLFSHHHQAGDPVQKLAAKLANDIDFPVGPEKELRSKADFIDYLASTGLDHPEIKYAAKLAWEDYVKYRKQA